MQQLQGADYLGSTGTPPEQHAKDQDQGTKQEGETGKGAMARALRPSSTPARPPTWTWRCRRPEAVLAALAGDAPARSLVARGASGKSRDSGEDGYSDRSSTTSEGHHYEDDASETPSKTPEVTQLSVKTAPATGELYVVSGELPTVCGVYFGHYQSDVRPVVAAALQRNRLRGSVAAHVKRCASLERGQRAPPASPRSRSRPDRSARTQR